MIKCFKGATLKFSHASQHGKVCFKGLTQPLTIDFRGLNLFETNTGFR